MVVKKRGYSKQALYFTPERKVDLLNIIWNRGPVSKTDMARTLGIRQLSVNGFVNQMIKAGILRVEGMGHVKQRGRKTCFVNLNPSCGYVIGAHVRDERIDIVCCDLKGQVLHSDRVGMDSVGCPEDLLDRIVQAYEQVAAVIRQPASRNAGPSRVLGLGIAVPGSVNKDRSMGLYHSHFSWWRNVPFKERLSERLGLPVSVDNDVRMAAQAEIRFGYGKGLRDFLYVDIGDGAAMAIVINGCVYLGNGFASEWGHTTLDRNGPRCSCGNIGCLDELLRDPHIRRRLLALCDSTQKRLLKRVETQPVIELLSQPWETADSIRQRVLDEILEHIGIAMINLVNTFNPSLIVLGGSLSSLGEPLLEHIRKMLKERTFAAFQSFLDIRITRHDETTIAAHGATALVLEDFYRLLVSLKTPDVIQSLNRHNS